MFGFFVGKIWFSLVLFYLNILFITTFTISFMFDFIKNMNTSEQRTHLVCDLIYSYIHVCMYIFIYTYIYVYVYSQL